MSINFWIAVIWVGLGIASTVVDDGQAMSCFVGACILFRLEELK